MLYWVKNPAVLRSLYPRRIWRMPSTSPPSVYLTFDDGPHPEITPRVLELLAAYNAKASFFLVGERAEKFPALVKQIQREGHTVGNHGYHHLNGWKTPPETYVEDAMRAVPHTSGQWFRPPYGRIRSRQAAALRRRGMKIVMWDVISGDFDQNIDAARCRDNVLRNVSNGSLVVFHDSEKARPRMEDALEAVLEELKRKGHGMRGLRG